MGFHRIALRMAALEALAPSSAFATGSGFTTIAGNLVYDSRQDPIDELSDLEVRPLVMIFTEQEGGDPYGTGRTQPDDREVTLVFELQIASRGTIEVSKTDGGTETVGTIAVPVSDAWHEALLDVLEGQIEYAIRYGETGKLWRRFATLRKVESVPLRQADDKTRLAGRTVSWTVCPLATVFADPSFSATPPALPQPLAGLRDALPEGSRNRDLLDSLLGFVPNPAPLTRIEGIDLTWTLKE